MKIWYDTGIEVYIQEMGEETTQTQKIEELLARGVENIYPNKEFVQKRLQSGEKLTVYLGIDPTGESLHIGHAITLRKLKEFQDLGHKVILLIGDFTALYGDPDKTETRKILTDSEVKANAKKYKSQASKILSFSPFGGAVIKRNSTWLKKLSFQEVMKIASYFTVEYMIKRDLFKRRLEKGTPLYIHEFMYPLMQGFDSVAMNVDGEVGGNDQTFNMLAGRNLMKQMKQKEKFVITTKLLTDKEGTKMGKTTGNMIRLDDVATDMFGKIMSWNDEMIIPGFELCTTLSLPEIKEIQEELEKKGNPKDAKERLAFEITKTYHSLDEAHKAKDFFQSTFSKKKTPEEVDEIHAEEGASLMEVLVENGLLSSRSEFRRLVEQGAILNKTKEQKVEKADSLVEKGSVYRVGKMRFVKII